MDLREARRFHGIFRAGGSRSGARLEGSADASAAAFRSLGFRATHEPIESGPPGPRYLGVLRTLGSPWVEVSEPAGLGLLTDGLLGQLSAALARRTFLFRYAFERGEFRHRLFDRGEPVEALDAPAAAPAAAAAFRSDRPGVPSIEAVSADIPGYLDSLFRALRMRDWGIGVGELARIDIPFPPTLIVESYFLKIER